MVYVRNIMNFMSKNFFYREFEIILENFFGFRY